MFINSLLAAERVYAFDTALPILFWVTVGILAAIILVGIVGKVLGFSMKSYVRYAVFGFVVYLLIVALVLLGLAMARNSEYRFIQANGIHEYFNYFVFLPIFACVAFALTTAIVLFTLVSVKAGKTATKAVSISLGVLLALCIIAAVTLSVVFYTVIIAL